MKNIELISSRRIEVEEDVQKARNRALEIMGGKAEKYVKNAGISNQNNE